MCSTEKEERMLQFRDFAPALLKEGWFSNKYETLRQSLDDANAWIAKSGVDVVNVETVVLPNIWNADEHGTKDVELNTPNNSGHTWHQFIRVWYRAI
jgi:hypothetical protein